MIAQETQLSSVMLLYLIELTSLALLCLAPLRVALVRGGSVLRRVDGAAFAVLPRFAAFLHRAGGGFLDPVPL